MIAVIRITLLVIPLAGDQNKKLANMNEETLDEVDTRALQEWEQADEGVKAVRVDPRPLKVSLLAKKDHLKAILPARLLNMSGMGEEFSPMHSLKSAKSKAGMTSRNKLNSRLYLDRLVKIMESNEREKKKLSIVYYGRRRSMGDAPVDAIDEKVYAIDRQVDDLAVNDLQQESQRRKRGKFMTQNLSHGTNVYVWEVLSAPPIRQRLTNAETLQMINHKASTTSIPQTGKHLFMMFATDKQEDSPAKSVSIKVEGDAPRRKKQRAFTKQAFFKTSIEDPLKPSKTEKVGDTTVFSKSYFEVNRRLNEYVPIALYLCQILNMNEQLTRLFYYDANLASEYKEAAELARSDSFLQKVISKVIEFDEHRVFDLLLENTAKWEVFFSEDVMKLYVKEERLRYLHTFLKWLSVTLQGMTSTAKAERIKAVSANSHQPTNKTQARAEKEEEVGPAQPRISKAKIVSIIISYFNGTQENDLLIQILKNLGFSYKEIVGLLLLTKNEERVTRLLRENKLLAKNLDPKAIIDNKMYKVLTTYDPMDLINKFNLRLNEHSRSSLTIYQELCNCIKSGKKIQSICFIIMHVNITFWDFDKLWLLFKSLQEVLRYDNKSQWLTNVDNPLLFCMRLAYFFQKIDKMLDINSKEIKRFCSELVKFSICYIQHGQEESLILDFFDRDSEGLDFLQYCFLVKEKEIFNIDFVTKTIYNKWDLGRHSKGSLYNFFKVYSIQDEVSKFDFSVFSRSYEMPIEANDSFKLDFYLTSRSILLRVVSDILWPYLLIGFELVFSLDLIARFHADGAVGFDEHLTWLHRMFEEQPASAWTHLFLRISYIASIVGRLVVVDAQASQEIYLTQFYVTVLALYLLQTLAYPFYFPTSFWLFINLEMLIVVCKIAYSLYLGLSLNWTGVILRIFWRMVCVVVVFALTSVLLITVVAYPLHIIFVGFSQVVEGQTFPQLNMFSSLYNGVLTLFEFTFGAVVFVRPYLEQNLYTYSMTLVMVVFSFFGNIMLANMLVAFLANQFVAITAMAKYYTMSMQFKLVKSLQLPHTDAVFNMPFLFSLPCLPLFLLMVFGGSLRRRANSLLNKFVHLVNIVLPCFVFYLLHLTLLSAVRYCQFILKILSGIFREPLTIVYLLVWLVAGPVFLAKLLVQDMSLFFKVTLNFKDSDEEDLFVITLSQAEREELVMVFQRLEKIAQKLIAQVKKNDKRTVHLNRFLFEMTISFPQFNNPSTFKLLTDSEQEQAEEAAQNSSLFNRNKFQFKRRYGSEGNRLYKLILKKFISYEDRVSNTAATSMEIDLRFLLDKFQSHLTPDKVHYLISFDKSNLELAQRLMRSQQEPELKTDLNTIRSNLDALAKNISSVIQYFGQLEIKPN